MQIRHRIDRLMDRLESAPCPVCRGAEHTTVILRDFTGDALQETRFEDGPAAGVPCRTCGRTPKASAGVMVSGYPDVATLKRNGGAR